MHKHSHHDPALQAPQIALDSLEAVGRAFSSRVPNDALRGLLNTRVFLRTGVNLRSLDRNRNTDAELVHAVLRTLEEFGYNLRGQ